MKSVFKVLPLLFVLFLVGCSRYITDWRPISQDKMYACHSSTAYSEHTIAEALIGRWQWIYTESYWAPEAGRNTRNDLTSIEFLADSTLNVYVDGALKGTTKWYIKVEDHTFFGVAQDSSISYLLYGRIMICDNLLEFNHSYIDGEDNYFEKTR